MSFIKFIGTLALCLVLFVILGFLVTWIWIPEYFWLIFGGLFSLGCTAGIMAVGLILILTKKKPVDPTKSDKMQDEVKSIWQWLGFADETPNVIRAIVAGNETKGAIITYIMPKKKYDPATKRMIPSTEPMSGVEKWLLENYSKRYFGIPILTNLRPLMIDRVVRKAKTVAGKKLADLLESEPVKRYGLYEKIFRPTYIENIDCKDGTRFNVTCYTNIEVLDPEPAFVVYKDTFLQDVSEMIATYLSKKVIDMTWDEYKVNANSGTKFILDEINTLLEKFGVTVTQLTMSDPELNSVIQSAIDAEKKAEVDARIKAKEGTGEGNKKRNTAQGEADAIRSIALARKSRFEELITLYKANGVTGVEAVDRANAMVQAEFNAEAISKLTGTYVAGGAGVQIGIQKGAKP